MFAHLHRRRGFTLIELAIVLGVVGLMSAGLWRLMSTGNQQTRDQAAAAQQIALINAVKGYLADTSSTGGQVWMTQHLTNNQAGTVQLPTSNSSVANCQANISGGAAGSFAALCNYLPTGFTASTTNPYGQSYQIQVLKDNNGLGTPPVNYSFMIITLNGSVISDVDGGRISGIIGGDGGFVYASTSVCGVTAPTACGALGAWQVNTSTSYGYAAAAGHVASRTYVSSTTGVNSSTQWLARIVMPGDTTFSLNTMTTDLYMGSGTNFHMPTTGNYIALNNSYITGSGAIAANQPQIGLAASLSASTAFHLIQLAGGCSAMSTASCGAALYLLSGDISVPNGEVAAQKIYSVSDARLKTDIRSIPHPLESLMKIDPVTFIFRNNGTRDMGVTAQNLEKVYPQLVSENNGTKVVEYNGLIGPLIGAVQELEHQNDDLRAQLRQQDLREKALERRLHAAAP